MLFRKKFSWKEKAGFPFLGRGLKRKVNRQLAVDKKKLQFSSRGPPGGMATVRAKWNSLPR